MQYNLPDMTPENEGFQLQQPADLPLQAGGMSEIGRITGVFFEPGKTFTDIAQRPAWIVPMLLVILSGLIFCAVVGQRIGWDNVAQQQMDQRMAKMSPEQRVQAAQGAEFSKKVTPIFAYTIAIVGPAIGFLISALVLLGIVSGILSAPVRFGQVFAVMTYTGMVGVVQAILMIVVVFLKANPADFDIQHPLMFNAGALMDPNGPNKFMYTLASWIDIFSFWKIFLIATGLKAAAGKKLSFGGAMFAVLLPWCVMALASAALAGIFG
jgi:Yip1 domain